MRSGSWRLEDDSQASKKSRVKNGKVVKERGEGGGKSKGSDRVGAIVERSPSGMKSDHIFKMQFRGKSLTR